MAQKPSKRSKVHAMPGGMIADIKLFDPGVARAMKRIFGGMDYYLHFMNEYGDRKETADEWTKAKSHLEGVFVANSNKLDDILSVAMKMLSEKTKGMRLSDKPKEEVEVEFHSATAFMMVDMFKLADKASHAIHALHAVRAITKDERDTYMTNTRNAYHDCQRSIKVAYDGLRGMQERKGVDIDAPLAAEIEEVPFGGEEGLKKAA